MAVKKMSISEIENLRKDSNSKIKTGDKMTQEQIDFYRAEAKKKTIPLEVDGKNFGNTSLNAYLSIRNNTLDGYTPVDIEEKRILDEYKKYVGYTEAENSRVTKHKNPIKATMEEREETFKVEDGGTFWGAVGTSAKHSLENVKDGLKSTFVSYVNNEIEKEKYDPVLNYAENAGLLEKGHNKEYGDIIDKQIESANKNLAKDYLETKERQEKEKSKYNNLPKWQQVTAELVGGSAQLIPQIAVGAIDPALGMSMLVGQVYGNSYAEALSKGASKEEAVGYGMLSATTELAIEKAFGGIPKMGQGVLSGKISKGVSKLIENPTTQKTLKYIFDAVGEGAEEVASEFLSPYIKMATYDENPEFPTINDYLMSFGGGFVGSALFGSANLAGDLSNKEDVLKYNEKKLDSLLDDYYAEISKNGNIAETEKSIKIKNNIKKIRTDINKITSKLYKKNIEVGDVFKGKSGQTKNKEISIIERNDKTTTAVMTTPKGSIEKVYNNDAIDKLLNNANYEFVGKNTSKSDVDTELTNSAIEAPKTKINFVQKIENKRHISSEENPELSKYENWVLSNKAINEDGTNILLNAERLQNNTKQNGKEFAENIEIVGKTTDEIKSIFENVLGKPKNLGALYNENICILSQPNSLIDENFIKVYSETYARIIGRGNSTAFKEFDKIDADIGEVLSNYILKNTIPRDMNEKVLQSAGASVKNIVLQSIEELLKAGKKIYGNNLAIANQIKSLRKGDFSVVVQSNDTPFLGNINLQQNGNSYIASGASAETFAEKLHIEPIYEGTIPRVEFPIAQLENYLKKLNGYNVNIEKNQESIDETSSNVLPNDAESDIIKETSQQLTPNEEKAINDYKSSGSYVLNEKMRGDTPLSDSDRKFVSNLNSALDKFDSYTGYVYRNIGFYTKEEFDDFVSQHKGKNSVTYEAFTSASKAVDGYLLDDDTPYKAHFRINSVNGRDLSNLGLKEEAEILFKSGTAFDIHDVRVVGNEIYLDESESVENGLNKIHTSVSEGRNKQATESNSRTEKSFGEHNGYSGEMDNVRGGSSTNDELSQGKSESKRGGNIQQTVSRDSADVRQEDRNEPYATREPHLGLGEVDGTVDNKTISVTEDVSYTNDGETIKQRYKIVDVNSLIASNDTDGSINKNYPQELQPRDRSRVAEIQQILKMSNNIIPEKLGVSANVSDGAPIVGSDNVVESGNGRTLALKLMYENGKGENYINWLKENVLKKYGISADELPNNPVLVRERLTNVDRKEFARKANETTISSFSATEQSKIDSGKLTYDILSLLVPNDNGNINTSENHDFIQAVVQNVFTENERNSILNANGNLSQNGLERITNALFYKAYGDEKLASVLSENIHNDIRNITNVLVNIAPQVVVVKNSIKSGNLYNYDFSKDIVNAIKSLIDVKNRNMDTVGYYSQMSLVESDSEVVRMLAYVLEQKNRGAKQATIFFNELFNQIYDLGNPNQLSFNHNPKKYTKEQLVSFAVEQYNRNDNRTGSEIVFPKEITSSFKHSLKNNSETNNADVNINPSKNTENDINNLKKIISEAKQEPSGVIKDDIASTISNSVLNTMDIIAKTFGIRVKFVENLGFANGLYSDGVVCISKNSNKEYASVFSHELTHAMRKLSSKNYTLFERFAVNAMAIKKGISVNQLLSDSHLLYSQNGIELNRNEVIEEITADYASVLFDNEIDLRLFIENTENKKHIRNLFYRALQNIVNKLSYVNSNLADTMYSKFSAQLDNTAKMLYSSMYKEAQKNKNSINNQGKENVKFSLKAPVEQDGDLIAVHNLSNEKLLKSLKLGGLPMPSIAVTKAEMGHNGFGDISLIFDKSAIDPKRSTANEVYSGDAYTPTYPRIEYEADETVADVVKEKVTKLVPYDVQRQLGFNIPLGKDSITSELNTHGGNITEIYAHSYPMMYAFLKDTGFTEELPRRTQRLDRREKFSNDMIIEIAEELGIDEVEKFRGNVSYGDKELRKLFLDKINKHLEKEYKAKLPEQDIEKLRKIFEYTDDKLSLSDMIDIINGCYDYLQNGVGTEIDYHEARELILKNVDKAAYDKWLLDMLDGIIGKEGIRNNKDIFTPSGNRRKFDALHYEHTLENVIKAMKEQPKQAIGGFTDKNLFGGATQSMKSIAEIKSKSHRLQDISEVEYNKIRDEFNDRYYDLSKRLAIHSEGVWDAGDLLVEAIMKYSTRDGIANYIQREGKGWTNYSPDIVDELIQLVSEIRDMPTRYFEAKPRRAVGFDEVKAVVIPAQHSYEEDLSFTKKELEKTGIPVVEYEYGDNNARIKALNSIPDIKFSISQKDVEAVQSIERKSVNDFTSKDIKKTENFAKSYFKEMTIKSPFFRAWFGDWRSNDKTAIKVVTEKGATRGIHKNIDTGWDIQVSGKVFGETKAHQSENNVSAVSYLDYIDSIVENAVLLDSYSIPSNKAKSSNSVMMHSMYALSDAGNGVELIKMYVEELNDVNSDGTIKRSYQLQNIAKAPTASVRVQGDTFSSITNTVSADEYSISDLFNFVKRIDKKFNPKLASNVVNEDGTPKVMYHGTSADFWVFDKKITRAKALNFGKGFYFASKRSMAENYTETGRIIEAFVNIKKPYEIYGVKFDDSDYDNISKQVGIKVSRDNVQQALRKLGYDGIIAKSYNGKTNPITQVVAFDENQIKSATNNAGTFDSSNPDIRFSIKENIPYNEKKQLQEYIMQKNSGSNTFKNTDCKEIGNNFYIWKNKSKTDYDVLGSIPIIGNENIINLLRSEIENGTDGSTKTVYKLLQEYRNGRRRNNSHDALRERAGTNGADGRLSLGQSTGDERGNIAKSSGDKPKYSISQKQLDEYDDLVYEYGAIPKGENPSRDVDVPKYISDYEPVSRFARTMMEAEVTDGKTVSEFQKRILDGTMTHEVITNRKALDWANSQIKYNGFKGALQLWDSSVIMGAVGKKQMVLGMVLYNQCIDNKDVRTAMKLASELIAEATNAGQTLQATRMLKMMTPDGQLYYLEKAISKMNAEFKEKLGERFSDIELDENLMAEFLNAKDEDTRDEVYGRVLQHIADQMPATLKDKWDSWRYLAMLGNARTHIRNIVGNAVFIPAVRTKTFIGAVVERLANVKTADRVFSMKKSKEAKEYARKDFDKMQKIVQGDEGKYSLNNDINDKRIIFKTKWLEALRKGNFKFLEAEDLYFLKLHYIDALARIITVRKIDVNSISHETLDNIRAFAIKEAQAATYRDANAIADGITRLQRSLGKQGISGKFASALIEGAMPFKRTPLNIAKQGAINYSPIGLIKSTAKMLKNVKKSGTYSTSEVIDDLAKGLTGTTVILLGVWLSSLGLLVGRDDEESKKEKFDKMNGETNYALKIGDSYYTIDWAVPLALPLFIGAEIFNVSKDDYTVSQIANAIGTIAEPLLELSVFSGVSDLMNSISYTNSDSGVEKTTALFNEMMTSYLAQAFPTIGGQVSRIIDNQKRDYWSWDKKSGIPKIIQQFTGQVASKIPFASYLYEPVIDLWGRKVVYGNVFERFFENTISPGYYSEIKNTVVDVELNRLYELTGESDVFPTKQKTSFTVDGKKYYLNGKNYTKAQQLKGQKSYELIRQLIQSNKYKSMSYENKIKEIKKCYDDANDYTKDEILKIIK